MKPLSIEKPADALHAAVAAACQVDPKAKASRFIVRNMAGETTAGIEFNSRVKLAAAHDGEAHMAAWFKRFSSSFDTLTPTEFAGRATRRRPAASRGSEPCGGQTPARSYEDHLLHLAATARSSGGPATLIVVHRTTLIAEGDRWKRVEDVVLWHRGLMTQYSDAIRGSGIGKFRRLPPFPETTRTWLGGLDQFEARFAFHISSAHELARIMARLAANPEAGCRQDGAGAP